MTDDEAATLEAVPVAGLAASLLHELVSEFNRTVPPGADRSSAFESLCGAITDYLEAKPDPDPEAPAKNGTKADWAEFLESLGVDTTDMSRDDMADHYEAMKEA